MCGERCTVFLYSLKDAINLLFPSYAFTNDSQATALRRHTPEKLLKASGKEVAKENMPLFPTRYMVYTPALTSPEHADYTHNPSVLRIVGRYSCPLIAVIQ